MLILCSGMFRSASTWQYQVAGDLAQRVGAPVNTHGVVSVSEIRSRFPEWLQSSAWHIVKTHVGDPYLEQFLNHPNLRVLYSYRDIRDVVYSMAHKTGSSFRTTIDKWSAVESCLMAERLWPKATHLVEQRYGHWIEDSVPWVHRIARCLGFEITPAAALEVAELFSLANQKKRTEQITEYFRNAGVDLNDPANVLSHDRGTLLHWNHIREGRVGHWRSLATTAEKLELHRLCGEWLIRRGYEKDSSWAYDALPSLHTSMSSTGALPC